MPTTEALLNGPSSNDEAQSQPRLIVKFRDGFKLPKAYEDHLEDYFESEGFQEWEKIAAIAPGAAFFRLIIAVTQEQIESIAAQAVRLDSDYKPPRFDRCYILLLPANASIEAVRDRLLRWEEAVEYAYPPPLLNLPNITGTNPCMNFQFYLDPAPLGVDARYAWMQNGGDGSGQEFTDIEGGWNLNNKQLCDAATGNPRVIRLSGTIQPAYVDHGNKSLGVVCATDDNFGCVGIAYNTSSLAVISHDADFANLAAAILLAGANFKNPGGILLMEASASLRRNTPDYPVEIDPVVFSAIQFVTKAGHLVIEPAGNGGLSLDAYQDTFRNPFGGQVLNPGNKAEFLDSGALIVGAGVANIPGNNSSQTTWTHRANTNYGSRVNCFAWGDRVTTIIDDPRDPYACDSTFNGTSSASAIVAGAALCLQGMAVQSGLQRRLTPSELIQGLADPVCGTNTLDRAAYPIGYMPNLACIGPKYLPSAGSGGGAPSTPVPRRAKRRRHFNGIPQPPRRLPPVPRPLPKPEPDPPPL